jgi:hypothetical protein
MRRGRQAAERLFSPPRAARALIPIGLFAMGVTLAFAAFFLG